MKWRGKSVHDGDWVLRDALTEQQIQHFRENVEPTLEFQVTGMNDDRVSVWHPKRVINLRKDVVAGSEQEECLVEWENHTVATWEPIDRVPQKMVNEFRESSANMMDVNTDADADADADTTAMKDDNESGVDDTPVTPQSGRGKRRKSVSTRGRTPSHSRRGTTQKATQDAHKRDLEEDMDDEEEEEDIDIGSTFSGSVNEEATPETPSTKKRRILQSGKTIRERQESMALDQVDELAAGFHRLSISNIFYILEFYSFPFNRFIHMILRYLNHLKSKSNRKDSITPEKLFFGYFKRDPERTPFMIFRNISLCDPCSLIPLSMRRTVVEDKHLLEVFTNLPHLRGIRIDRSQLSTYAINAFLDKNHGIEFLEVHYPNDGFANQLLFNLPDLVMNKMRKLRIGFSSGEIEDMSNMKEIMKHMVNLDNIVERVHEICPNLTDLDLDDSCEMTTMSDKGLEIVFQKMKLQKLSMVCVGISASQLSHHLSRNTTLTRLAVKSSLHNSALDAVTNHPRLNKFHILLQQAFTVTDKSATRQTPLPKSVMRERWQRFLTRRGQYNRYFSIAFDKPPRITRQQQQAANALILRRQQRLQMLETTKALLDAIASVAPADITLNCFEMIGLPKIVAERWTGKHFEALANIPTLRKLRLVHCRLNDTHLQELARTPFIDELILDHNRDVGDVGVRSLLMNTRLKRLDLVGNNKITDDCILKASSALPNSNLETLSLSQTGVRNVGVNILIKSCSALHTLDVHMCALTNDAFLNLPNNTTLKALVVAGCTDLTDDFLNLAAQSHSLSYLNVQYCVQLTTQGFSSLSQSQSLTEVNFATDRVQPFKGFNYDQWVASDLKDVMYKFADIKNLCRLVISHEQFPKQKDYRDLIEKSGIMVLEMPKPFGLIDCNW